MKLLHWFTIAMATILVSCIKDDVADSSSLISEGDHLPKFTIIMNDGIFLSTGELAGAPSVIMLFTTKCPDCRRELPVMEQLHRLRPELRIVCIAREENAYEIADYWRENGLTLSYSPQPDRKIYNLFATETVPRTYIADSHCIVTATFDDTSLPTLEQLLQLTESAN